MIPLLPILGIAVRVFGIASRGSRAFSLIRGGRGAFGVISKRSARVRKRINELNKALVEYSNALEKLGKSAEKAAGAMSKVRIDIEIKWAPGSKRILMGFPAKAMGRVAEITEDAAYDVYRRIVSRTPVDTGRARAGWRHNIDRMGAQIRRGHNGEAMIWNNVPYIRKLEEGHSQQAPNGMVATTLREWPRIVDMAASRATRSR